jgi:hypothetical protein
MPSKAVFDVAAAITYEEVERLRPIWESLQHHLNSDIDFFCTIAKCRDNVLRPHVLVLREDGVAKDLLVGRVEIGDIELRIGYKTVFKIKAKLLVILHRGFLGHEDEFTARKLFEELLNILNRREVDAILFHRLDRNSFFRRLLAAKSGLLCGDPFSPVMVHWGMTLSKSLDDVILGMKSRHRSWLRRKRHKVDALSAEHQGQVTFRIFSEKQDIPTLWNDLEFVAKKSYQRGIGVGFMQTEEQMRRLSLAAEKGWLRACVLYVDNVPCAFWLGNLYKGVFGSESMGYDPKLSYHEIGTIVIVKMLEYLCQIGAKELDFGFGEAFYKQRLGNICMEEMNIYLFSPTLKSVSINCTRMLFEALDMTIRKTLVATGLYEKIKKYWRGRLQGGEKSHEGEESPHE